LKIGAKFYTYVSYFIISYISYHIFYDKNFKNWSTEEHRKKIFNTPFLGLFSTVYRDRGARPAHDLLAIESFETRLFTSLGEQRSRNSCHDGEARFSSVEKRTNECDQNETTGHFADENLRTTVRRSHGRCPEIHLVSDNFYALQIELSTLVATTLCVVS